jgi:hypothetical protein
MLRSRVADALPPDPTVITPWASMLTIASREPDNQLAIFSR